MAKMDPMHAAIDAPVVDLPKELRFIAEVVEQLHAARDPERAMMATDFAVKRLEMLARHVEVTFKD